MKTAIFHGTSNIGFHKRVKLNRRGALVSLLTALVLWLTLPFGAQAHAQLVRSNPPNQASLTKAPAQLQIWFSELLEDGFNSVDVFPAGQVNEAKRTSLVAGKPSVDPKNPSHLSVPLRPLPAGEYMAEWRVLSRDGHSAPGRLTFRVLAPQASGAVPTGGKGTGTAKRNRD